MNGMEKIARTTLRFNPWLRELAMEFLKTGSDKEREAWFEERTDRHVSLVMKYCKKIERYAPDRFVGLVGIATNHDDSKYKEPERTSYIALSWKHKDDNYKSYKKPGTIDDPEINKACIHHIKHNAHHPEFWDDKASTDSLNEKDRGAAPAKMVDGTKMPDIAIAEMVADWMAMSEELGNSVAAWAKKSVNVRWKFSERQVALIDDLIANISVDGGSK